MKANFEPDSEPLSAQRDVTVAWCPHFVIVTGALVARTPPPAGALALAKAMTSR
jgi:hypothetical protein